MMGQDPESGRKREGGAPPAPSGGVKKPRAERLIAPGDNATYLPPPPFGFQPGGLGTQHSGGFNSWVDHSGLSGLDRLHLPTLSTLSGFSMGSGSNVHELLSATKSVLARLDSREIQQQQVLQQAASGVPPLHASATAHLQYGQVEGAAGKAATTPGGVATWAASLARTESQEKAPGSSGEHGINSSAIGSSDSKVNSFETNSLTTGSGEGDNEESTKKEKAVKVKKIFLRILRKVMEIPNESPLLLVWREGRIARKTGKQYPPGWYGIEVMDVEEVDAVIKKLLPELSPKQVGMQDWTITLAHVLHTTPDEIKQYVILKNCRYRLNEGALREGPRARVRQVRAEMQRLHEQAGRDAALLHASGAPNAAANASRQQRMMSFGDTPMLSCLQCGGIMEQCVCSTQSVDRLLERGHSGLTSLLGTRTLPEQSVASAPINEGTVLRRTLVGSVGESFQRMWQAVVHLQSPHLLTLASKVCELVEPPAPQVSSVQSQQQQQQQQQQMRGFIPLQTHAMHHAAMSLMPQNA